MASKFSRWVFGALAGAALVAAPRVADAALVGFCDFNNAGQVQGLSLNGSAQAPAGVLYLTPNGAQDTGSAYLTTPVNLTSATSWQTHFRFRMYPNSTDPTGGAGIAFALQNKSPSSINGSGGKLGMNGLTPSVGVAFFTLNSNSVRVFVDGNVESPVSQATPSFNMKNGTVTDAWIDYDAPTTTLKVYVGQGIPKPATPIVTSTVNVYNTVDALGAGNKAWIGFTASAGNPQNNYQDILYWVFANDGTPLTDCVTCVNNNQCVVTPTTPVCNNDPAACQGTAQAPCFCVQCTPTQQQQCVGTPTPVCNPDTNTCVECNTDAQCGGNKPVCQNHICVPCQNSAGGGPPACSNPNTPVCQQPTDPLPGSCTECSAGDQTHCTGTTPVCLPTSGTCGCTQDSQCGPANGGLICSGTPGVCVPGCRPNGTVTCPNGGQCSDPDNDGTGVCVVGCSDATQCAGTPTPVCNCVGTQCSCVTCNQANPCPSPQVCTPQNTCVECTPGNTTNCDPNGTGGACRPNGQCGCNTDSDCGGATSGRVCDDTNKVCRSGCRGSGGNGCPTQLQCTSTTTAIGQCVNDSGDGGVPDGGDGGKTDGGTTDGGKSDSGSSSSSSGSPTTGDSGLADDISIEGAGCNCTIVPAGGALPIGGLGAAALGLVAMLRRRRGTTERK